MLNLDGGGRGRHGPGRPVARVLHLVHDGGRDHVTAAAVVRQRTSENFKRMVRRGWDRRDRVVSPVGHPVHADGLGPIMQTFFSLQLAMPSFNSIVAH